MLSPNWVSRRKTAAARSTTKGQCDYWMPRWKTAAAISNNKRAVWLQSIIDSMNRIQTPMQVVSGNSRAQRLRSALYDGSSCTSSEYGYIFFHYLMAKEEGRQDEPLDDTMDSQISSIAYSSADFWRVLWRGGEDTLVVTEKKTYFHLNHAAGDNNFLSLGLINAYRRVNKPWKSAPSFGKWISRQAAITIINPTLIYPTEKLSIAAALLTK